MDWNRKLILDDGSVFQGFGFGGTGDAVCEIVFNTSMTGYQEILSDPSYTDQAVVMSYPLIGNYGITNEEGDSAVIKSHHNVGGLPDVISFETLVEPLRELFKDEVRSIGTMLGLPGELVWRQPSPGPGLAVRIIGEITGEKLRILKEADAIFREEVNAGTRPENRPDQYFAVLTNTRSVGVMGDARTYGYTVALRAVSTDDFMTAEWTRLPYEVLEKAGSRIANELADVSRVVYDISSKPPATVEWE